MDAMVGYVVQHSASEISDRSPSMTFEVMMACLRRDAHESIGAYVAFAQPIDSPELELKSGPSLETFCCVMYIDWVAPWMVIFDGRI